MGVPVYKLLGGKRRDRVRVYNGNLRHPIPECTPEAYAADVRKMRESREVGAGASAVYVTVCDCLRLADWL